MHTADLRDADTHLRGIERGGVLVLQLEIRLLVITSTGGVNVRACLAQA